MAATVSVSESDIFDQANRCGYIDGEAEQFDNWINCSQPMRGQFSQLQMFLTESFYLQMYEVEVHGYYISDDGCRQGTD